MIRSYITEDKPQVIDLIKVNTPQYFDASEEAELSEYLDSEVEDYFVIHNGTKIVGAGGINYGFEEGSAARISWDMIHSDAQGQGLGRKLVQFRINEIKNKPSIKKIIVRTSQLVYPFYEKNGFELVEVIKDYWAPGYDLYNMKMDVN